MFQIGNLNLSYDALCALRYCCQGYTGRIREWTVDGVYVELADLRLIDNRAGDLHPTDLGRSIYERYERKEFTRINTKGYDHEYR